MAELEEILKPIKFTILYSNSYVSSKSRKQSVKLRAAKKKHVGLLKFANVLSSNPAHGEMYSIFNIMTVCKFFSDFRQVCGFLRVQVCQWLAAGLWFSQGTSLSVTCGRSVVFSGYKFVSDLRQVCSFLRVQVCQ